LFRIKLRRPFRRSGRKLRAHKLQNEKSAGPKLLAGSFENKTCSTVYAPLRAELGQCHVSIARAHKSPRALSVRPRHIMKLRETVIFRPYRSNGRPTGKINFREVCGTLGPDIFFGSNPKLRRTSNVLFIIGFFLYLLIYFFAPSSLYFFFIFEKRKSLFVCLFGVFRWPTVLFQLETVTMQCQVQNILELFRVW